MVLIYPCWHNANTKGEDSMNQNEERQLHHIIKKLRIDNGYTQQDVAEKLGVDKSTYAHYEAARRTPDIRKLRLLAELYGLQDELLGAKLPIVAQTIYPKEMLDNLEETILSCKEHTGDYAKDKLELDKLKDALKPVMSIRNNALDLPAIPLEKYGNGTTIKQIKLDVRAERLIFECIDKQSKVMGW